MEVNINELEIRTATDPKNTPFYIDSKLAEENLRGEDISKIIYTKYGIKNIILSTFFMLFSISALADSTCSISWVNAASNKIRGSRDYYSTFNDTLAQVECRKLANVYAEMFTLANNEQDYKRNKVSWVKMYYIAESLEGEIIEWIKVKL